MINFLAISDHSLKKIEKKGGGEGEEILADGTGWTDQPKVVKEVLAVLKLDKIKSFSNEGGFSPAIYISLTKKTVSKNAGLS